MNAKPPKLVLPPLDLPDTREENKTRLLRRRHGHLQRLRIVAAIYDSPQVCSS